EGARVVESPVRLCLVAAHFCRTSAQFLCGFGLLTAHFPRLFERHTVCLVRGVTEFVLEGKAMNGHPTNGQRAIAYFSMEIGLNAEMPTYSGGLGALAGDTVRAAADLRVPLVAVSLLHRTGYFYQRLDADGWQHEEPVAWDVDDELRELPARAAVA